MAGELILIVEDNEKNRRLERDVLQFHGYRTMEAETGEDGVRLARISGIEALHRLRADSETQRIAVMAVTASAMTQDRQTIMAAGFDGYLSKPINLKDFVAAVRAQLDRGPAGERAT